MSGSWEELKERCSRVFVATGWSPNSSGLGNSQDIAGIRLSRSVNCSLLRADMQQGWPLQRDCCIGVVMQAAGGCAMQVMLHGRGGCCLGLLKWAGVV